MKLRSSLLVLHRWLALAAGVFWGLVALTGGILVFEQELSRRLNAGRFETTPGSLAPGELDRVLAERFAGATIASVGFPGEQNLYVVRIVNEGGTEQVYLDGGTGAEIQPVRPPSRLIGGIRSLHTSLFLRRPGSYLVTFVSGLATLGLLSGLFLWWPGFRRILDGFKVRLARGLYIASYDLHNLFGITAFTLLLVMTATGVFMGTPRAGPRIARVLFAGAGVVVPPTPEAPPGGVTGGPGVEALAAAAEAAAGERVTGIAFPVNGQAWADAALSEGGDPRRPMRVRLSTVDGAVLGIRTSDQRAPEERIEALLTTWHMARFPSLPIRLLFAASCVLGSVLVVTGYVVWWLKRTRMLESARRRAQAAAGAS